MAKSQDRNTGYIYLPMGNIDIYILTDGFFSIGYYQPTFAPHIPSSVVQNELRRLHLNEHCYEAPINMMLVKTRDSLILVDTGEGLPNKQNAGKLLESLSKAGFSADAITDIIITHAHQDHIGGILSENDEFVFPNAKYFISRDELEFWTGDQKEGAGEETSDSDLKNVRHVLDKISMKLTVFEPGIELFSCIKTEKAPGHTPGHIIFEVFSAGRSITHLVDIVHSPLLIAKPEWGTRWDVDFQKGISTRIDILERCYVAKTLVCATHLPWPGIGYIEKKDNQFCWSPIAYNSPHLIKI